MLSNLCCQRGCLPVGVENVTNLVRDNDVTGQKVGPDHVWGHVSISVNSPWIGLVFFMHKFECITDMLAT